MTIMALCFTASMDGPVAMQFHALFSFIEIALFHSIN
jgi:hypothetical protein